MNRKNIYLFLCVLGVVLPYSQFIPWVMENGLHLGLLFRQLFANRISSFFGLDVLVSAVVLIRFVRLEGRRLRVRHLWLPIVGVCAVGVSFALPLFLYLREPALDGAGGPAASAPAAKP
ncbi:MAG: DUF2834 domain-containing protein [Proteobacteria bacterium]|nr:DUF2834 domain-containing protein [Pseudomonadota bacterium]